MIAITLAIATLKLLAAAGILLTLCIGMLWLRLLWRIRSKLSDTEKFLNRRRRRKSSDPKNSPPSTNTSF